MTAKERYFNFAIQVLIWMDIRERVEVSSFLSRPSWIVTLQYQIIVEACDLLLFVRLVVICDSVCSDFQKICTLLSMSVICWWFIFSFHPLLDSLIFTQQCNSHYVLLQLMDELETVLADTSNEELTNEKKIQYASVSYNTDLCLILCQWKVLKSNLYGTVKVVCILFGFFSVDKSKLLHFILCCILWYVHSVLVPSMLWRCWLAARRASGL